MEELPQIILNALSQNTNTSVDELKDTIGNFLTSSRVSRGQAWRPPVDVVDTKNMIDIYVDLPGIDKKNIEIDVYNNRLTINGKRDRPYCNYSRHEIVYGKFSRDIILPISVTNKDNVKVEYKNGILHLLIDKESECKNKFRVSFDDTENDDKNI